MLGSQHIFSLIFLFWQKQHKQLHLPYLLTFTLYVIFDTSGQLSTKLYDKRDDFNFAIIKFPHFDNNIPTATAYGVYVQACSLYSDFLQRHRILSTKLFNSEILKNYLILSLKE